MNLKRVEANVQSKGGGEGRRQTEGTHGARSHGAFLVSENLTSTSDEMGASKHSAQRGKMSHFFFF